MRPFRLPYRLLVLGSCVASGNCVTDLFTGPGAQHLEIEYLGDSIVLLNDSFVPPVRVLVNGSPLVDPQLRLVSSDTNVIVFSRLKDRLVARARGRVTVVASLQSSVLSESEASDSVTLRVVVKTVTLDRTALTMTSLGDSTTLVATAMNAQNQPVSSIPMTWQSSDTSVLTVSPKGRVTARKAGLSEVRAIIDLDTARAMVRVRQDLAEILISPSSLLLASLDQDSAVSAAGYDAREGLISGFSPNWVSANPSVAGVDASGHIRARQNGQTWVMARSGTVVDSIPVRVDQRATSVVIAPKPVAGITAVGGQRQLAVTALDALGHTVLDDAPTWGALTPLVVRVTTEGLVTALAEGTGQVLATLDGAADTATIVVHEEPVSIELLPASLTLTSIGDTSRLRATVRNARNDTIAGAAVSWTTPDAGVVSVLQDGRVIATGVGVARVIGATGDLRDTSFATVTNAPAIVAILPTLDTLRGIGDSLVPALDLRNDRNAPLPRTAVTWASDDHAVARVTSDGVIIAQGVGQTIVRASYQTLRDSILIVVTNDPAAIVLSGSLDTLTALGQVISYGAEVRNARGTVLTNYPVSWRSTNTGVATVAADGTIVAVGFGSALVIGRAGDPGAPEDTVTMVVKNPTLLHVDNAVVIQPRFGTLARPYARIQDAVVAADANDTVVVHPGALPYAESVALSRRITLLGDSAAYVAAGRNPLLLPRIAHDSGATGISVITTAPVTIRYFTLVHTLDGLALDALGTDIIIEHFHVNPTGTVSSRIGRGIRVKDSPSGSRVANSSVASLRGFGVRFDHVFNGVIENNQLALIDSMMGVGGGSGIKVFGGSDNQVRQNTIARTEGPEIFLDSTGTTVVTDNLLAGRRTLIRLRDVGGSSQISQNVFDLTPRSGEILGSLADGRAGLEILSSIGVLVGNNTFTDTTTSANAMDGVHLVDAANVSFNTNTWTGGRYQIRSQRSQWSVTGSRFTASVAAIVTEELEDVAMGDNDIADHTLIGAALDNAFGFTVTGGGNWWGDARGPRRSASPQATGDSVSGPAGFGTLRLAPVYAGSAATGLRIVRGNNQTASIHPGSLPLALTVRVIDDLGRPVAGVSVTFTVTAGGGLLNGLLTPVTVISNTSGLAEVSFRLGGVAPGINTVSVTGTSLSLGSITFTEVGT